MPGRRFREDSRTARGSSEADLAHQNLVAINADLRRQLEVLENSTSFRLGRLVLRSLQPIFTLLRIKRFSNRRPSIEIESTWPRLRGTITVFQPSAELIPVKVRQAAQDLLEESIDPSAITRGGGAGPWSAHFEFRYPLGFRTFDKSELTVRIGNVEFTGLPDPEASHTGHQVCRPIDIAVDSIIEVRGDVDRVRNHVTAERKVAVLSTYRSAERESAVPHDLASALRAEGFGLIVVDTSDELPDHSLDCDLLVHRRNIGWDFASWMSALAAFPWLIDASDNLLLVNDSNVGPITPLKDLLQRGRDLDADIWGITDSWDIKYHLQSYFLHFNASTLRGGHLHDFLDAFTFPSVKERIIGSGEIGLSQFMIQRGLRLGAVFPYVELAESFLASLPERVERILRLPENRIQVEHSLVSDIEELTFLLDTADRIRASAPVNPTHYFWDILVSEGCPFIKRDLITKNPDLVSGLHRLPALLSTDLARRTLAEEMRTWPRTHPDISLPLAFHWQAPSN